jgi:hypothetical protein
MKCSDFVRMGLALGAWMGIGTANSSAAEGSAPVATSVRTFSPADMAEDIQHLVQTLEAVHPNLYFHASRAEAARRERVLRASCAQPLDYQQFCGRLADFVASFGEDHTTAYPSRPPEAKAAPVPAPASWRFQLIAPDCGYLDFRIMRERAKWQTFLQETFRELETKAVPGLIIDLRNNEGGNSELGDDLLGYLTDRPYRPVTRKCWRFSAAYLPQISGADPWGLSDADPSVAPPPEYQRLFAQNPTPAFTAWLRTHAPDRERAILERHAPHWLGLAESKAPPTETLCLEFPLRAPSPAPLPRFTGRVCFLISHRTFSSAVILANIVEDFHLAPLVGEETKPCNQFGEPFRDALPHSGLRVDIATAQYVRANGDASDPHGVLPTIAAPADVRDGKDLALEAALRCVRNQAVGP